jgi:hypothetical protein
MTRKNRSRLSVKHVVTRRGRDTMTLATQAYLHIVIGLHLVLVYGEIFLTSTVGQRCTILIPKSL